MTLVRFHFRLLGRMELSIDDGATPVRISTRKASGLIAYLAMSPAHKASREELATLLWGTCSDQQARQSLRQALVVLRKDLRQPDLATSNTDLVQFLPGQWWVDACEFEQLTKSSDPTELSRAAGLFGGEFLAGFHLDEEGFDEWAAGQRQRMQRAAARLCETFAARPDLVADGEQALEAVERLLALDPLREDWQRLALTLHARYRGKSEALAHAEEFAALLRRELGVGPERRTQDLVGSIRDGAIACLTGRSVLAEALIAGAVPPGAIVAPSVPEVGDDAPPATALIPAAQPRRWPVRTAAAAGAIVVLGALTHYYMVDRSAYPQISPAPVATATPTQTAAVPPDYWRPPSPRPGMPAGIIPIAVLPFTGFGEAGSSTQLIADLMTDDLVNVLSRVPAFRVISPQTTNSYRDRPLDVAAIGAELQVKYVLEGSAREQGGLLRVNLQLLDPATRLPVWSGRIAREGADRYAVRDEIVARIARELQIDVIPIEGERRSADHDADASAYLGWAALQAAFSKTDIDAYRKAEAHFKQALERDPQHVSAFIGLGTFHANLAVQRLDQDTEAHFEQAHQILTRTVERDPHNPNALYHLGVLTQGRGKIKDGLTLFEQAVELNPSNAGAHAHIGHALARLGQAEKGLEHIRYAMRLSPRDPAQAIWHEFLGNAQLELGQYAQARESFAHSLSLAPRYPRPLAGLTAAHALAGDADGVKESVERLKALVPGTDAQGLIQRLGRRKGSALHEGLRLALVPADPWQSPALPSRADARPSDGRTGGIVALAVLPFTVAGEGGESSRMMAELVADDLIGVLSRSPGVRVISRQSSGSYRGQRVEPAVAGTELGVPYVLTGSADLQGNVLRLHVELIDTRSHARVWSGDFERSGADRHAIQDEIVNGLGRELSLAVATTEGRQGADDPDTHQLIVKGWNAISASLTVGAEALKRAEAHFTQALASDPENPRARTGLGAYHVQMAVQLLAPDPTAHLEQADAILKRVIEQHPNAGQAYHLMGLLHIARGEGGAALTWFEKSVALDPSFAPAYAQIGRMLTRAGNPDNGLKHVHYAMRLSPRDPSMSAWLGFAGSAELERKNYAKAIEYLDRAIMLHPKQPRNMLVRIAAHALAGNMSEARTQLEQVRKAYPHLTGDKIIDRFFGGKQAGPKWPQLKEGLRLAVADPWRSPPSLAGRRPPEIDTGSIISIAVLPFTSYGESSGGIEMTADMLTDDLTNLLSRNRAFRVISRATARSFKDRAVDLAAIGTELQVRYVLEGSVRMLADKLRVNVELIDSASRTAVWSGRIERDGADQHGVQDEIAARLARELHFEILPVESARRRDDPSAVALVYRGYAAMNAAFAKTGGESFKKAESLFKEALERDPENLQATIGLGAYHANVGAQALAADSKAHLDQAREILTGVLVRAPNNGAAPFYLGLVHGASGRLDDALAAFTRAVEINPSHASAHAHIGHALARMGRAPEGLEHLRYAMRLSPRDPNLSYWYEFLGGAELALDHYDKAIENFGRSNAINPGYPRSLAGLAAAHALAGNIAEARKFADRLRTFAQQSDIEVLLKRFGRNPQTSPQLHAGLRLALTPPTEFSRLPAPSQH
jgi:TolB-like protein/Tfp pilus assembly protein PilF/DNA-binding SARP family transcriptional activator